MKKTAATFLICFLIYTGVDILFWQRIFEAHSLWTFDAAYHHGWQFLFFGLILLGSIGLFDRRHLERLAVFISAMWIAARGGMEDVFYYWLDGRAIPARLPWLNADPMVYRNGDVTATGLLLSVGFWISISVLAVVLLNAVRSRLLHRPYKPLPH